MTTKEVINEQIHKLELQIKHTKEYLDEICDRAEDTGYDVTFLTTKLNLIFERIELWKSIL